MSTPPFLPPPGCPAHGLGQDGPQRLYGPAAEHDPMALYEELRAKHGAVAPVLVHDDQPACCPARRTRQSRRGWRRS
ncbi:hypothetical protein AB0D04_42305, partial [Streptomyces sp. NPDC048483]